MKAYAATTKYGDCSTVIWAETAGKAKSKATYDENLDDAEFADIRVNRLPLLDDMEDCEPKDNPWLNEKIRTILAKNYGWHCIEPNKEKCKECCAREYCGETDQ